MSLKAEMEAFSKDLKSGALGVTFLPEWFAAMDKATADLIASGQAARTVKVGDKLPSFALEDQDGVVHSSDALLAKGPLIVSFYRGVWCPYCNLELKALERALPTYRDLGANIVAISPQNKTNSRKSVRQNELSYPILSDPFNNVAGAFGLRFALPKEMVEVYILLKNNLPAFNGDESWTLPMPGRFVADTDGTLLYAEVNPDYTKRPEAEDLIPALRKARLASVA
jgi:peroxiredoxin